MVTAKQAAPWVITVVVVAALVGVVVYYSVIHFHSIGRIVAVGIAVNASSIDWGDIPPGGSSSVTVQLWNNGTVPVAVNVTLQNFNPAAAGLYMRLESTWPQANLIIQPDATVNVQLNLMVSSDVHGFSDFTVDVVFTASETT